MLGIESLEKLVHELSRLPSIGPKTAQRLAYYILKSPASYATDLMESLQKVKSDIHQCPRCFSFTDQDLCRFCKDVHRSEEVLCVVEEPSDIQRVESSGAFRGRYHVLHGTLSPLDGIGPQDLRMKELMERLHSNDSIREVILALDADLEGDTTVLYLVKQLQQLNQLGRQVKITRIAHGVPIGSDIDFVDERTMGRALENRISL